MKCTKCWDIETCSDCEIESCHICCEDYTCPNNVLYEENKRGQNIT
jgi:hypothetical protein